MRTHAQHGKQTSEIRNSKKNYIGHEFVHFVEFRRSQTQTKKTKQNSKNVEITRACFSLIIIFLFFFVQHSQQQTITNIIPLSQRGWSVCTKQSKTLVVALLLLLSFSLKEVARQRKHRWEFEQEKQCLFHFYFCFKFNLFVCLD